MLSGKNGICKVCAILKLTHLLRQCKKDLSVPLQIADCRSCNAPRSPDINIFLAKPDLQGTGLEAAGGAGGLCNALRIYRTAAVLYGQPL